MVKEDDASYKEQMGFMLSQELKSVVENYARQEGIKPAVVIRKALVQYLQEKGVLKEGKYYL